MADQLAGWLNRLHGQPEGLRCFNSQHIPENLELFSCNSNLQQFLINTKSNFHFLFSSIDFSPHTREALCRQTVIFGSSTDAPHNGLISNGFKPMEMRGSQTFTTVPLFYIPDLVQYQIFQDKKYQDKENSGSFTHSFIHLLGGPSVLIFFISFKH